VDEYRMAEDPIAFAKEAAETLAPLGVRYFEFKGLKLAFEPILAQPAVAAPVQANGLTTAEEAALEAAMDADTTGDPINDPTTFPGGKIPSYAAARRRRRPEPELEEQE
jgi:hypothetical protein